MRRAVLISALIAVTAPALVHSSTQVVPVGNLIQNPGAEVDTTVPASPPTGWAGTQGALTALNYGADGFLASTDPGCPDRGKNFFYGGAQAISSAKQVVDVSGAAAEIDGGVVSAHLTGYLGGWKAQDDNVIVRVAFLDAATSRIGTPFQIGPVLAADRGNVTGLVVRTADASVPARARKLEITQTVTRTEGTDNDGSADCLSLELVQTAPLPPPAKVAAFSAQARPHHQVVITWRTAAETGIASFNVLRKHGRTVKRANRAPIAAKKSTTSGGAPYLFTDAAVQPGATYVYSLQLVRSNGTSTTFGSARIVAKR